MAKLKWDYCKRRTEYTSFYFRIRVSPFTTKDYTLFIDKTMIHCFKKLSTAKQVAQIIYNG